MAPMGVTIALMGVTTTIKRWRDDSGGVRCLLPNLTAYNPLMQGRKKELSGIMCVKYPTLCLHRGAQ